MQKPIHTPRKSSNKLRFETWVGDRLYSSDLSCGNEKVEWIKSWQTDARDNRWWEGKKVSLKVRYANQRPKTILSVMCGLETKQE